MTWASYYNGGRGLAASSVYISHSDLHPAFIRGDSSQPELRNRQSLQSRAQSNCRQGRALLHRTEAVTITQVSLLLQTTGPVFGLSMGLHGSKHPQQAQIVMLGLDGSGKSTLLYKLKYNESVVTVPTVGFNVEMLETEARGPGLTVWDVGGQQRMRPHWKHHYPGTEALVFVVDSWDRRRLEEAKKELHLVIIIYS
ncbi:ADP-ribosylation factor 1-like 2 [Coregonus clupeaformis]|uniref:ADP-ribosylation factor 1-like 2 n=1 Tax=Coregonus clupeaformis TaxID=59861 RepID=UPI001E1C3D0E|nr:ADP-ribosylation factor 1-like 2 [Coregonus clupeaformis]